MSVQPQPQKLRNSTRVPMRLTCRKSANQRWKARHRRNPINLRKMLIFQEFSTNLEIRLILHFMSRMTESHASVKTVRQCGESGDSDPRNRISARVLRVAKSIRQAAKAGLPLSNLYLKSTHKCRPRRICVPEYKSQR